MAWRGVGGCFRREVSCATGVCRFSPSSLSLRSSYAGHTSKKKCDNQANSKACGIGGGDMIPLKNEGNFKRRPHLRRLEQVGVAEQCLPLLSFFDGPQHRVGRLNRR